LFQRTQCSRFERVFDHKLRPGFQHGQIAESAGQILVAQLALDPGSRQYVARMRDL
jgi:hypothetical protein